MQIEFQQSKTQWNPLSQTYMMVPLIEYMMFLRHPNPSILQIGIASTRFHPYNLLNSSTVIVFNKYLCNQMHKVPH